MASIYDVEIALTNLAQTAVYPNGITAPSVANCNVKIFPGNPIPDSLDFDLAAGNAQVSIFPGKSKGATRFDTQWIVTSTNTPTITATANFSEATVIITGTVSTQQTVMIIVNDIGYAYAVQSNDTLNSIAASLAAAIPGASANNNVITIVGADNISTNISVIGAAAREVARELRDMVVTVWAPNPIIRSVIGNAIAVLFSATYRVLLPDGYYGQLKFFSTDEFDDREKVIIYKRIIHFDFEYGLTQAQTPATVADNIVNVSRVPS
jgi:hypothetical protein